MCYDESVDKEAAMRGSRLGKVALIFAVIFLGCFWAFAEETGIRGLYRHTLDNGMELFVAENDNVPLVYAEVAVHCGAFTQTLDTAGLFHLYEHMMFKGNELFPNAAALTRALSDMGAGDWNGSTDVDCVNYFVTVPATLLEKVVEFWASAIRTPLLSEAELENEKRVVLSEIKANTHDEGRVVYRYQCEKLFSDAPWTLDPSGSEKVVSQATRQTLCALQSEYYIPKNTALFIGGSVKDEEVLAVVKTFFGDWENTKEAQSADNALSDNALDSANDNKNADSAIMASGDGTLSSGDKNNSDNMASSANIASGGKLIANNSDAGARDDDGFNSTRLDTTTPNLTNKKSTLSSKTKKSKKEKPIDIGKSGTVFRHADEALTSDVNAYMPYKKMATSIAQITTAFRGPDAYFSREDTYIADVLAMALSSPTGAFMTELVTDGDLGVPGSDYVWVSFPTSRNSAVFTFGLMCASSGKSIAEKTDIFNEKLNQALRDVKKYISSEELKSVTTRLLDEDLITQESAEGLLRTLRFWWAHADANYYFDYKERIAAVTLDALQAFCDKYFLGKHHLSVVLANPQVCKEQSSRFRYAKFQKIK